MTIFAPAVRALQSVALGACLAAMLVCALLALRGPR